VEPRPRTLWALTALGVVVVVVLVLLLAAGERSGGAAPSVAQHAAKAATCRVALEKLTRAIDHADPATQDVDPKVTRASFVACRSPQSWRVGADRAGVSAALGRLDGYAALEADRALDVLCRRFDRYNTTAVCKAHVGSEVGG
jgi:hypothetical protein